jgi:glycosyltransferase involved in cell wall biosynthesis
MRVLNLNDYDLMNRRFNGYDLMDVLGHFGKESRMLVIKKQSANPSVKEFPAARLRLPLKYASLAMERATGLQSVIEPASLVLPLDKWFRQADVVHLHLIHNDVISLYSLPLLSSTKPVVWTVHDPWIVTGHCIYPSKCSRWRTGCGNCPDLRVPKKVNRDSTNLMWRIKKSTISKSFFTVVVGSKWMKGILEASPLFANRKIEVVPFGVNLLEFSRSTRLGARQALGWNQESVILLFRASSSPFKGLEDLKRALMAMRHKERVHLVGIGETGMLDDLKEDFKVTETGRITDEKLHTVMRASDVFIMPSKVEAFGLMTVEAMASGLPVVAYSDTALEEIIGGPDFGAIVGNGDIEGLTEALEQMMNRSVRDRLGQNAHTRAIERYGMEDQAWRLSELYDACAG